jgi:hypothetical protein
MTKPPLSGSIMPTNHPGGARRSLTAFEVPALQCLLVPVEINGPTKRARCHFYTEWGQRVRRWHRTGGK